jgi:hypothetical protein
LEVYGAAILASSEVKTILAWINILVYNILRCGVGRNSPGASASTELDEARKCCRYKSFTFIKDIHRDGQDAPPGAQDAGLSGRTAFDEGAQIVNRQVHGGRSLPGFEDGENGEGGCRVGQGSDHAAVGDAVVAPQFVAQFQVKRGRAAPQLAQLNSEVSRERHVLEDLAESSLVIGREWGVCRHER